LDDEILQRATIYVESREAALKESGDVIAADKAVVEIGEVIAGKQPARRSADEIMLFKSVGVAAADVAAADLVYQKRAERVSQ
jgi:ornithine cyclodeaminase/alanine dehydrogenase-like protein (mu-crystallin family)